MMCTQRCSCFLGCCYGVNVGSFHQFGKWCGGSLWGLWVMGLSICNRLARSQR